ncbi:MAG: cell envelope biogenesis protein OmpA [Deltaproteobacteria bacterium]|nr:cell envelope biogenesis protein OmpA [Deltaproteobacteria bacterium]
MPLIFPSHSRSEMFMSILKMPERNVLSWILCLSLLCVVPGCAKPPKPQLYPNQHLLTVGQAQSQFDIADCENLANAYVEENKSADIAKKASKSAVLGGVMGAAAGAIRSGGSVSNSAATGAAIGAAGSTTKGVMDSNDPSTLHKNFVNRCLSERGYDVMGWK